MIAFNLFGFPVVVRPGFLFIAAVLLLFGLEGQWAAWKIVGTILVYFVSILVHELGHAVTCRILGVSVEGITVGGFGGEVRHGRASLGRALAISLAGPFAGIALGIFGLLLYSIVQNAYAEDLLVVLIGVNFLWSFFNLLPIFPMDGGQATLTGLQMVMKPRVAAMITFGTGFVLAVFVALAGLRYGWIFVAFFAGSFALQNFRLFNGLRGAQEG